MFSKKFFFTLIILGCFAIVFGRAYQHEEEQDPKWIIMMQTNANYYATIEAFREFWEGKALPEEPFEDKEMDVFEREVGLIKNEADWKSREYLEKLKRELQAFTDLHKRDYASEVRAFKGWMQDVKPWVQKDGTIISLEEQQKLIDQQRNELKEIEQQNKR